MINKGFLGKYAAPVILIAPLPVMGWQAVGFLNCGVPSNIIFNMIIFGFCLAGAVYWFALSGIVKQYRNRSNDMYALNKQLIEHNQALITQLFEQANDKGEQAE